MGPASEIALAVRRTPREALSVALSKLSDPIELEPDVNHVIVKPSIYDPAMVGNTAREMVQSVVDLFSKVAKVDIVESDNPLRTAEEAFDGCGYTTLRDSDVHLVNLTTSDTIEVKMPGHRFEKLPMPVLLESPHLFVNIATLKPEPSVSLVGAGLKNLFGLIPEVDKRIYHKDIHLVLLDLLKKYPPDLTVIDLTNVVVGAREDGITENFGGVIVGRDPVAVDAFCAYLLGYDPGDIPHIQQAYELGLGQGLLDRIRILGTEHQLDQFSAQFQKGPIRKGFMNA
jgi:uncharacterized protein (DUF362 family)